VLHQQQTHADNLGMFKQ